MIIADDTTKSKASHRTLPLVPIFHAKLIEEKAIQDLNRKLCGKSYNKAESKYIYTDAIGNRINPNYLTNSFPKFLAAHDFRVMRFHDLRQILGLTWTAVDFKKGRIKVNRQLQKERKPGGIHKLGPLKNDKERVLTPPQHIMRLLEAIKLQQNKDKPRTGAAWQNSMNLVFTDAQGRFLSAKSVYDGLKRVTRELGLDGVRFHDLRHPYVKHGLKKY